MKSNVPAVAEHHRQRWLLVLLAIAWLFGFAWWFHHFELPNNHVSRWLLSLVAPLDLLDLIDPPEAPGAVPWSWFNLSQRVPFVLIAATVWVAAAAIGSLILRGLESPLRGAERLFFALSLGLSAVSLLVLVVGVSGRQSALLLATLLTLPCLVELVQLTHRSTVSVPHRFSREWTRVGVVIGMATLPFVLGALLGAMTPQNDFDVVEYHLGGPKEWFLRGRIERLPHNVYTSFPFLSEMLIYAGMLLYGDWEWGALAGQEIIGGFAPLTALGLYAAGRRWFSPLSGWLAAMVYLTSPWTYRITIIAYAESGLACYLFGALFAALLWREQLLLRQMHAEEKATGAALLIGLLSGSAMACKYTGLVSVVIPMALFVSFVAVRNSRVARWRQLMTSLVPFGIGVLLAIGPWLLKNGVETGNPVYPLAVRVFGGADRDPELDAKWVRGHAAKVYPSWGERLHDIPVKLADVMANNDWHSPLMFGFAPLSALWLCRRRPPDANSQVGPVYHRDVILVVWLDVLWQFTTWWGLTHHIDRFYVPMFSTVALLAGIGATWWLQETSRRLRWIEGGAIGLMIVWSLLYNAELMTQSGISGFNAGRMDLRMAQEIASVPRVRWLDEQYQAGRWPQTARVLCVGEVQMFHAHYPYLYNTVFNHSLLETICALPGSRDHRLRSADDIRAEFARRGIQLIDVNWMDILRYREPGNYGYTDFVNPSRFEELQRLGLIGPPLVLPPELAYGRLDSDLAERLRAWAPQLITTYDGKPAYIKAQIYPILPATPPQ